MLTNKPAPGTGKILAVLGAQYGSEGKGVIAQSIANEFSVHVRVGSPNAGHTFHWKGEKHVMQSIPCGWTNPRANIVIGRGALISMKLLLNEIEHVEKYYPAFRHRLFIDADAGVLDERFHEQEGGTSGEMHRRIGSTGEGVGPARMARLERDPEKFHLFRDVAAEWGLEECMVEDTPALLMGWKRNGHHILLEGTQGSALSLLHSYWPYCTSIDTNAAAILSEVGLPPRALDSVLLVARTFPIRVAGNSGPMNFETTWEEISRAVGHPVEERTTVTKKVRRVAHWDDRLIERANLYNAPTAYAITFADYLDPAVEGVETRSELFASSRVRAFINSFQDQHGVPVALVGTGGPDTRVVRLRGDLYDGRI